MFIAFSYNCPKCFPNVPHMFLYVLYMFGIFPIFSSRCPNLYIYIYIYIPIVSQYVPAIFVHGLDIFLPFSTSSSPFLIFYRIFSIFPLSFLIFPLPFPSVCYIFHICPSDFGTCLRVDSRLGYVPVCLCVDLDFAPQDLRNVGRYSLPGVWCILRWPSFGVHTLLGVPHAVVAASHMLPRQSASASLAARRCDPAHA